MEVKITAFVDNWKYEKNGEQEQFIAEGSGKLIIRRFGNNYEVKYEDEYTSVMGFDCHLIDADNVEINFNFYGGALKIKVPNGIPEDIWDKLYANT